MSRYPHVTLTPPPGPWFTLQSRSPYAVFMVVDVIQGLLPYNGGSLSRYPHAILTLALTLTSGPGFTLQSRSPYAVFTVVDVIQGLPL